MSGYLLQNVLLFTITTIFNFFIAIVLLRLMLQLVRADFHNPIAKSIVKITNPVITPIRMLIPGFYGVDWSTVIVAFILQATLIFLTIAIKGFSIAPTLHSIGGLSIWSIGELLDILLIIILYAIIAQVIMSWVANATIHRNFNVLTQITAPLYRPLHKYMPDTGAIDLTPMVLIFLISIGRMLITTPLIAIGKSLI